MKRGIWYILLMGVCIYVGILNRKEIYICIACTMALVMILLWISLLKSNLKTKLKFSLALPAADKGQTFYPAIEVRTSGSSLPAVRAKFRLIGTGSKTKVAEGVTGIEKNYGKCQKAMQLNVSGRYRIQANDVRIYDALNIFYIKKKIKDRIYVYVLPECYNMAVDITKATRDFVAESDIYYSRRKGDDYSEAYQIREYHPGDKIMNINWKMTARLDELMVKDPARPIACPVIICMWLYKTRKNYSRQLSAALEAMVSISYNIICLKVPHYIAWYDEENMEICRYRVLADEDVYEAASRISAVELMDVSDRNVEAEYKDRFRGEEYTTIININISGQVTCGDLSYPITFANLKKDIEAIYLRV